METLRRQIHPEVRVIDRERGIVDYVASDETVDSYREVIRAAGWRFNHFKKNAPFVDSHNYNTIGNLVGRVTDFRVDGRKAQLINRVQWAVDVADNQLAQVGWKMTESGYLKAVSVGFLPVKHLTATSARRADWLLQLQELGLTEENAPRAIYVEQEQIELSAVIIGANANALLAAHKAGAINDRDVELFQKRSGSTVFQIPFAPTPKPQTTTDHTMSRQNFISSIERVTAKMSATPPPPAPGAPPLYTPADNAIARAQRGQSALRYLKARLADDSELALDIVAMFRVLGRSSIFKWGDRERFHSKALTTADDGVGQALSGGQPGTDLFFDALSLYSVAYKVFNVLELDAAQTALPTLSATPNAFWYSAARQGTSITETTSIAGAKTNTVVGTLAALVKMSNEAAHDGGVPLAAMIMHAFVVATDVALTRTACVGDGVDDETSGGMTGLFESGDVDAVQAAAGNTSIETLDDIDFLNTMAAVDSAALSYPCYWLFAPEHQAKLMTIKLGSTGSTQLLKAPRTPEDPWMLLGYPVVWAPGAPSANEPGAKVGCFGRGEAFTIGLRKTFELRASDSGTGWQTNTRLLRSILRGRCEIQDAGHFATLALAAA